MPRKANPNSLRNLPVCSYHLPEHLTKKIKRISFESEIPISTLVRQALEDFVIKIQKKNAKKSEFF